MDNNGINDTINRHPWQLLIAPPYYALLPTGQKIPLILCSTKNDLPTYVDLKINQELNAIAKEFLTNTKIQLAVVDLLFKDNRCDGIEELLEHKYQK